MSPGGGLAGDPAPAGNPIGWLFLVTGVFMFLCTAGGDYGYYVYRLGHHLPLGAGWAS
jgi:hypothetical protein